MVTPTPPTGQAGPTHPQLQPGAAPGCLIHGTRARSVFADAPSYPPEACEVCRVLNSGARVCPAHGEPVPLEEAWHRDRCEVCETLLGLAWGEETEDQRLAPYCTRCGRTWQVCNVCDVCAGCRDGDDECPACVVETPAAAPEAALCPFCGAPLEQAALDTPPGECWSCACDLSDELGTSA